jgi:hypothetical protein
MDVLQDVLLEGIADNAKNYFQLTKTQCVGNLHKEKIWKEMQQIL